MSRTVIAAIGTRGDVGPAIFLARKLASGVADAAAGGGGPSSGGASGGRRQVVLVAPPENESAVRAAGIDFRPLGARFSDVVARGSLAEYREQIRLQFREHLELYEGADMLVGFSLFYAGRALAATFGLPYRHVFFTPQVFPSPSTTPPSARRMSRSKFVNKLLWKGHLAQEDFVVGRLVNEERARLGLSALRHASEGRTGAGAVLAVDPVLASLPRELAGAGSGIRQAHYWYHEDEGSPLDSATERFLAEGVPPILVGFGSADAVMKDARATLERLCGTLTGLGHRVLLVTSHPAATGASGAVHRTGFVPHAKVMPRCSLVIHHGGIGTVFAAARAGIRQLVVPLMLDQFFWAARVSEMQIGRGLSAATDLAGPMIGTAVTQLLENETIARRARELGAALANPARAVEVDAAIGEIFAST